MDRRRFLLGGAALAALPGFASGAIAQRAARRVIVDNDFAGDPDGLVALAHQLLSPQARTVLVTTSALDRQLARMAGLDPTGSAQAGTRLAEELLRRLALSAPPPVVTGAESFGATDAQASPAAHAIFAEALRDDPLPLFVTCGGPLTNVAAALRLDPAIARRLTLVWIGGSTSGAAEYNKDTDRAAARHVLAQADLPIWQVPAEEYRRFQVSVAELESDMRPISPAAAWLCEQYAQLPPFVQLGGALTFGDSPLVSATAFDASKGSGHRMLAGLDPRLNFADFTALLRLHARRAPSPHSR